MIPAWITQHGGALYLTVTLCVGGVVGYQSATDGPDTAAGAATFAMLVWPLALAVGCVVAPFYAFGWLLTRLRRAITKEPCESAPYRESAW